MIAWLFPGQGSQQVGMGAQLFAARPDLVARASAIAGFAIDELCLRDPQGRLNQTEVTQPCLFVVNMLGHRSRIDAGMPAPAFLAGHSLGELNALCASGALDWETALRLVCRRGALMAQSGGGGMAAVVGLTRTQVEALCAGPELRGLDVANFNTPIQIAVSGPADLIDRAEAVFLAAGARAYVPLPVSAPFHSRYMQSAADAFAAELERVSFGRLAIPVIANVTGQPYTDDAVQIRATLAQQMRSPVRWTDSVEWLLAAGVDTFEEVGPGTVLTRLVAQIRKPWVARPAPPGPPVALAVVVAAPRSAPAPINGSSGPTRSALRPRGGRSADDHAGDAGFCAELGVRHAAVHGAIGYGVSGPETVVALAAAGSLGFVGGRGTRSAGLRDAIARARALGGPALRFGVSVAHDATSPGEEAAIFELLAHSDVAMVELIGHPYPTPALIRYRFAGAHERGAPRRVLARFGHPDVADELIRPPSPKSLQALLAAGQLSAADAALAQHHPAVDHLAIDCESGPASPALVLSLLPWVRARADRAAVEHGLARAARVGVASGVGTPEAAAALFGLGAAFLVLGTIGHCTIEAATSPEVKRMLQGVGVADCAFAPTAEMFEAGGVASVLKRGLLFAPRAQRLAETFQHHETMAQIASPQRRVLEGYLQRDLDEVANELANELARDPGGAPGNDGRRTMARVFRWYVDQAAGWAVRGELARRVDFNVPCEPALGALNQWLRGGELEAWDRRSVSAITERILDGALEILHAEPRGCERSLAS
jgi:trans-AT polyketide synthase/acyltransferase/oxidoreductase domain-containing protein